MADLSDSFLADLDELCIDEDMLDDEEQDFDYDQDQDQNLDSVSNLQKTQRYNDIMKKVEDSKISKNNQGLVFLEDDDLDQSILKIVEDIDNEIAIIHNFIRDKYRFKFPELESVVHRRVDYARAVKKIGNEVDLSLVDLQGVLPSAVIMVVSILASSTSGKPLLEETLRTTIDACDRVLALDTSKKTVLDFVEGRMGCLAPNLSSVVGGAVAAKLIGMVGGLVSLSNMPACNVLQLLGAKKKSYLGGFSTQFWVGYVEETEILQSTRPRLKMRACRLVAAKATLAARVDSARGDPSGKTGRVFKDEIIRTIDKWQELPPAKQPKPLPDPDSVSKKKRGGRRSRKTKERYAMTKMRKLANRMQFGVPEQSRNSWCQVLLKLWIYARTSKIEIAKFLGHLNGFRNHTFLWIIIAYFHISTKRKVFS